MFKRKTQPKEPVASHPYREPPPTNPRISLKEQLQQASIEGSAEVRSYTKTYFYPAVKQALFDHAKQGHTWIKWEEAIRVAQRHEDRPFSQTYLRQLLVTEDIRIESVRKLGYSTLEAELICWGNADDVPEAV
jgi:hypothetical protein